MNCFGCDGTAEESSYGPWCSGCGGVVRSDKTMYVRHVADIIGAKQATKLLYDYSLSAYAASVTQPIKQFVERKGEWVQSTRTLGFHGSMDAVLADIQPFLHDDSQLPELVPAASATEHEKAELEL